jgi:hypothetical protein
MYGTILILLMVAMAVKGGTKPKRRNANKPKKGKPGRKPKRRARKTALQKRIERGTQLYVRTFVKRAVAGGAVHGRGMAAVDTKQKSSGDTKPTQTLIDDVREWFHVGTMPKRIGADLRPFVQPASHLDADEKWVSSHQTCNHRSKNVCIHTSAHFLKLIGRNVSKTPTHGKYGRPTPFWKRTVAHFPIWNVDIQAFNGRSEPERILKPGSGKSKQSINDFIQEVSERHERMLMAFERMHNTETKCSWPRWDGIVRSKPSNESVTARFDNRTGDTKSKCSSFDKCSARRHDLNDECVWKVYHPVR